jgi:photosystem II stability/assembly factor-like uncharacterized protein
MKLGKIVSWLVLAMFLVTTFNYFSYGLSESENSRLAQKPVNYYAWYIQYNNSSFDSGFECIDFVDLNYGWVGYALGGNIFRTIDGGENWVMTSPVPCYGLFDLDFVSSLRGWAVSFSIGAAGYGDIYRTDNGGGSWTLEHQEEGRFFYSIYFVDDNDGWAVGDGMIARTVKDIFGNVIDWSVYEIDANHILYDVYFIDENTGWAVGENTSNNYGVVYGTTDGGSTWEVLNDTLSDPLYSVYFTNPVSGWICDITSNDDYAIMYTNDGGSTWEPSLESLRTFAEVCFVSSNEGWAWDDDNMFARTSDGASWTTFKSDSLPVGGGGSEVGTDLVMIDSHNGWAVGSGDGIILHYGLVGDSTDFKPVELKVDGYKPNTARIMHLTTQEPTFSWKFPEVVNGRKILDEQAAFNISIWEGPVDTGILLWYKHDTGTNESVIYNETGGGWDALPLEDGNCYNFSVKIQSKSCGIWGEWNTTMFRLNTPPEPPELLSPANRSENLTIWPILEWSSAYDAELDELTYQWQVDTDNPPYGYMAGGGGTTPETSVECWLDYGEKYYWRVRAYDGYEYSVWSEIWEFTTVLYELNLSIGWNYFTLPLSFNGRAWELASTIGENCTHLAAFDIDNQSLVIYEAGSDVNNFTINDGYGYFSYVINPTKTYFAGKSIKSEILRKYRPGWNSLGWVKRSSISSSEFYTELFPKCEAAFTWNNTLGKFCLALPNTNDGEFEITYGNASLLQVGIPYNPYGWSRNYPTSKPSPRYGHAMAYDTSHDKIVLFGGYSKESYSAVDDTWSYNYLNDSWIEMNPSQAPSARYYHSMVYNSVNKTLVLFGGSKDSYTQLSDTWEYNLSTNTWTEITPTVSPKSRELSAMAYVPERNVIILFGGCYRSSYWTIYRLNDTWEYNCSNKSWRQLDIPAPSPRYGHAMVYDASRNRIILFGGLSDGYMNDTWEFDCETYEWLNITSLSPIAPSKRYRHGMVYDPKAFRIILFGGRGYYGLSDTWVYNCSTDRWEEILTDLDPEYRYDHALAFIEKYEVLIMFGGQAPNPSPRDETWCYIHKD